MKKSESKKEHIIYDSTETCEENDYWLDDERVNLGKTLDNNIIAIVDMGLWDGRHNGYKILGRNLSDVLSFHGCDDITVSFNGKDIVSDAYHHDGVHHILYRQVKGNVDIDELTDKIYNGTHTEKDIEKYTTSLGEYVKKIYGW